MLISNKQKRFSFLKKKIHFKNNLKKLFYKISFFLILTLNSFDYKKNIKICLCTVGKEENKYIIEFVEHYKRYGIDKIFLYDNNNINGEIFDQILTKYITIGFLEIINKRGYIGKQLSMFQECYEKNYKIYDWLLFFDIFWKCLCKRKNQIVNSFYQEKFSKDIDEYIHLQNYQNIKYFLINKKFDKCQSIYLNWIIHTDNNLIYYDNRSLSKRFKEIIINQNFCRGKTILRGNIKNIKMKTTHLLDLNITRCNGFGKFFISNGINCLIPDYNYNYIDHYYSKSTEEFINKIIKGDGIFGFNTKNKIGRIKIYFSFNQITKEKINFIEKRTNLNLSLFKKKIS